MASDMIHRACEAVYRKDLTEDERIHCLETLDRDYPGRGWLRVVQEARQRRERRRQQSLPLGRSQADDREGESANG